MFNKKIPTLIGLAVILIGAFIGVMYVQNGVDFLPRANPEVTPRQVKITNISENSFTVSWITQIPTAGFINLGTQENNLNLSVMDERDELTGESGQYRTHYITARGLEPSSKYYFKIGSGQRLLFDNNGSAFNITTAPIVSSPASAETIYGTILTRAQTPADDTIVYANIPGATPMSALVRQNGNYAIPMSSARTLNLQQYSSFDPTNSVISLLVQSGRGDTNEISITAGRAKPVPDIILGETTGNLDSQSAASPREQSASAPPSSSLPPAVSQQHESPDANFFTITELDVSPVIITDESAQEIQDTTDTIVIQELPRNGIVIQEFQPVFSGSAPPGVELIITVNSPQVYTTTLNSDETGSWQWQVPGNLEQGEHTLTISYADENGILQQVQRRFIIGTATAASPSYTATPSAQLSPTAIPQPTQAPQQPTIAPTVAPTIEPIRPAYPSTESGVPTAGSTRQTATLLLVGIMTVLVGLGSRRIKLTG